MWGRSFTRTSALLLVGLVTLSCRGGPSASEGEVVFAVASSLRHVMPELVRTFVEQDGETEIVVTYGGSGTLREQVEAGAPIDAVIFAGGPPVDQLIEGGHADAKSRRIVATNRLVLIGPRGSAPIRFETIERVPAGEMIAIGDPISVPVGSYAAEAFRNLGKWEALQDRLVFGGRVAAVLAYARRGEVAAAVVYRTDARGLEDVVVLDEARGAWAPRPEVVAAVTNGGVAAARAHAFLDFLGSPRGREILERYGFRAS